MKYIETISKRRSYYKLDSQVDWTNEEIKAMIAEIIEVTPSAVNMQEGYMVLLLDQASKGFWEKVNKSLNNAINPDKQRGFEQAKGTILFFIDNEIVEEKRQKFSLYAENFTPWSHHGNGMLQINLWNGLRDAGMGASLQHYNPVIDHWVLEDYNLPKTYELVAQMPFGRILEEPDPKKKRPIEDRLKIIEK